MHIKKLLTGILLFSILLLASGCVTVKNSQDTSNINGGLFKSSDKGTTWKQKTAIPTVSGKAANFSGVNAASLAIDHNDNQAVYFGSVGGGLLYTYNGGETWSVAQGLANMTIRSVAVDPKEKCTIYAAVGNKVYKSTDCSRSWSQIYFDNNLTATVDSLAIDHFDSNKIYIAISRGDLVRSADEGKSWQTIHRVKGKINKIAIDPGDSRNIYLLTEKNGVYRTLDGGESWDDLNKVLKENDLKLQARDLGFAVEPEKIIYLATQSGALKSSDGGLSWGKIELIPPEKNAAINAMAVNPNNGDEVYYVTNTTFYCSSDGGKNWTPSKLPSSRAGWQLLVDPEQPNVIYLGVRALNN